MLISYFAEHWWATFWVSAFASLLAILAALAASFLALFNRAIAGVMSAFAAGSQSFPLQAIAPLILITFGTGNLVKVGICFFVAFFPIYGNLQGAVARSWREVTPFLRVTRCASPALITRIVIHEALPSILAACKVGFTLSVLGAVVAEFILPEEGLGYVIVISLSQMQTSYVLLAVGLLIAQGLFVYSLVSWAERDQLRRRGVR